jgi:fermentation-respiration switch protein FrsA (DUF1100 family)
MRKDIHFTVDGLTCRGWYYRPDGVDETAKLPAIILLTGFGGVKEFAISTFAELFVERGFSAIVYDNRYTGESEGEPRGRIVPSLQHDDLRAAIGWVLGQHNIDPKKIILWGTSFGGGHALFVGALDPRVSAVITLVAGLGPRESLDRGDRATWRAIWTALTDDFMNHNATGDDMAIPIVAPPGQPCLVRDEELSAWLRNMAHKAPKWPNRITAESRRRVFEYTPTAFIDAISPRPLLMFAMSDDRLIPLRRQREVFAQAGEPKRLEVFQGGHVDPYEDPLRSRVVSISVEWLAQHGLAP